MTDPIFPSACPDCGAPLSDDKLCPACLMRQALISRTVVQGGENGSSVPPPSPEEIAAHFPQLEILSCLGRGGMGVVYQARQKSLNRLVAIKILAPERGQESRFAERFAHEAELLAQLNHPHIVTIHDFGETGGLFFLVMEFVDGVNLRDLLRDGKLAPQQALAIVPPICEALQFAHGKGIVHRDIKPENLLLDRDGRIKIADFGIAALIGAGSDSAGTPPYMAPEQHGATAEVDHRADIYALGVVLYEMLTGERPAKDLIAPSRKAPLDAGIDEMVLRALERSPDRRYQSADDFRTVVETMTGKLTPGAKIPPPPLPPSEKPKGLFRRYWWLFLVMIPACMALGFGAGAVWNFVAPERYESSTTFEVVTPRRFEPSAPSQYIPPSIIIDERSFKARVDSLLAPASLEKISNALRLNERWGVSDSEERLHKMIRIQQLRETGLVSIKVQSSNARQSAEIANALASNFGAGEEILIHEDAVAPTLPVAPNKMLNLLIFAAAFALLSPLATLMLIRWLDGRNEGKSSFFKMGWSIAILSFFIIASVVIYRNQQLPPYRSLSSRIFSPEIGRIEFRYYGERGEKMGGFGTTFTMREDADTNWFPNNGSSGQIFDDSFRVRSRAVHDRDGRRIIASTAISEDGIAWRSEDVIFAPDTLESEKILTLPNQTRVRIKWVPSRK